MILQAVVWYFRTKCLEQKPCMFVAIRNNALLKLKENHLVNCYWSTRQRQYQMITVFCPTGLITWRYNWKRYYMCSHFLPAASPGAFPSPGAGNSQRNKWCFHPLLLDMADQQCPDMSDQGHTHSLHTANASRVTRAATVSLSSSLLFPPWSHKER